MQRRPLTRIELTLQDIVEFKKFMELQKAGDPVHAEQLINTPVVVDVTATSDKEKRRQVVRQRLSSDARL
ncbi:hypothetical protein EG68_12371 [Paragonimus skrjabini miyazakii]|uniref:Anaphase-promoting complex subunit CDC26 n=1 Tax=Paragonimus skrjabini miyazakii TaxID=59628 RepID=A0A8S9YCY7_9TREM|nr:hypothetical protein EG68_12371 [Paragonimus skrjabini miyazakii]